MFPRESRPLKRPKLGIPDFYPQESKQREVRIGNSGQNSCLSVMKGNVILRCLSPG